MIESLPDTTVSAVTRRLVSMRQESGVSALGHVLTLVISASGELDESAIAAANHASSEHPMRVIVLLSRPEAENRLDAEIRVGADAGASDVIVLRASGEVASGVEALVTGLLLPDAPVAVWWPEEARIAQAPTRSAESGSGASRTPQLPTVRRGRAYLRVLRR